MVTSTSGTTNNNGSIGSSIVSALGSGSGIDSNKLADQLTEANKMVQAQRLTSQKTLLQTQISDYGLLRSSMAKLETAAAALGSADTFNAKSLSIPDTKLFGITKLDAKAVAGDYQLKIQQVAQAQSLSNTGAYSSLESPVGKGSLTIRLGEWNDDLTSFTVDSTKTGATIVIDDTNNTLSGLRDAINAAGVGVTAAIVSDGGGYKLLLTAKSGAKNEIEITADEDPAALGLANLNFNESTRSLTQLQEGHDAKIFVNGLLVSRESNRVTDVIEGLEFDLFASSTSETVSINISQDKALAEKTIRDFVTAYNTFKGEVESLTGFNPETKEYGSLNRDSLAKNLIQGVRNTLSASVAGLDSDFNSLSAIGVRTRLDGSLEIIESEGNTGFRAAIDNNFALVKDIFVPKTESSVSGISVTKYSAKSQPGTYEVVIGTQPKKGVLSGGIVDPASFPLNSGTKDYSFNFSLDGVETAAISLPSNKEYASGAELAADIQSLINLDANIKAVRAAVTVSFDGDKLVFTSNAYGSSSKVGFTSVGADMGDLGLAVGLGTAGVDVSGTVGGVAAFGVGNVLLPALGSPAEGLSMTVEPGVSGGSISFSRGFAGSMTNLINDFLKSSGLIKERENNINKDISRVEKDEVTLERRSEAYRARLMAQFQAMETIVRSLNTTGDFLDGIVDRLPFTAKS